MVDPDGEPVYVRSTSHWEALTTLDSTFVGITQVVLAARVGVRVYSGTYSGSSSSSEPITYKREGEIEFERPL